MMYIFYVSKKTLVPKKGIRPECFPFTSRSFSMRGPKLTQSLPTVSVFPNEEVRELKRDMLVLHCIFKPRIIPIGSRFNLPMLQNNVANWRREVPILSLYPISNCLEKGWKKYLIVKAIIFEYKRLDRVRLGTVLFCKSLFHRFSLILLSCQ